MESFEGRVAVVTGGGMGMGRELVAQLAAQGCHVATCDVDPDALDETAKLALEGARDGTRVTTCVADVSDESAIDAFRAQVEADHGPHLNLLFNNAGISGGGSFLTDGRDEWERTFAVTWGGVYTCCRVFMPMLVAAPEGHVINTSSVNGFWAAMGRIPHSAYSAAKFAVKGFTEALMGDFRANAPHVKASVVMPGHIGTSIVMNSNKAHGTLPSEMTDDELEKVRSRLVSQGFPVADIPADSLREGMQLMSEAFRDTAPTTAAAAATIILDGVLAGEWRILVGDDAHVLDTMVRQSPADAYTDSFLSELQKSGVFSFLGP